MMLGEQVAVLVLEEQVAMLMLGEQVAVLMLEDQRPVMKNPVQQKQWCSLEQRKHGLKT